MSAESQRQLRTRTLANGDTIETAAAWRACDIPASWARKGVLGRDCGCRELERFAFYALPDGRVAEIALHPMNGPSEMFVTIRTAELARERWAELLAGEPFEQRSSLGYGRMDVRRGRMRKARRVA